MEADHIKSSSQNHMGTLTMTIPLDKFSQSSVPNYAYNIPDSSDLEFSCESPTSIETTGAAVQIPYIVTSASSLTFMGNPVEETVATELSFSTSVLRKRNSMETMREMIFRMAMMQPIHIDPESVKPPKRKNVKISKDPQSVAARHRRERISERIRILQRLVPGGTKMDTASMLDEAAHYLKFLKKQVQLLEQAANNTQLNAVGIPTTMATAPAAMSYSNLVKVCQPAHIVGSIQMLS